MAIRGQVCLVLFAASLALFGCRREHPRTDESPATGPQQPDDSASASATFPEASGATVDASSNVSGNQQSLPETAQPKLPSGDVGQNAPARQTPGVSQPQSKPNRFATAQEAHLFAERSAAEAEVAASDGRLDDAYELALAGWEALQPHCTDGACQGLSELLLAKLEEYGEQLPNLAPGEAIDVRLKIR